MIQGSVPHLMEVPVSEDIMSSSGGVSVQGYIGYYTKGTLISVATTKGVMTHSSPLIQLLTY